MSREAARVVLGVGIALLAAGFLLLPQRIPAVTVPMLIVGVVLIIVAPRKKKAPRA